MRLLIGILVLISISACKSKEQVKFPIERDRIVALLADMRIAEQTYTYLVEDKLDSIKPIILDSIYRIHDVDSTKFVEVENFLKSHVHEYNMIETDVHKYLKNFLEDTDVR